MITEHTMNTKIVKSLHKQKKKENIVMVHYVFFQKPELLSEQSVTC